MKFETRIDHPTSLFGLKSTEEPIPNWLLSWRFETEELAILAGSLYFAMLLDVDAERPIWDNQKDFWFVFKMTLRIAQIESVWAQ